MSRYFSFILTVLPVVFGSTAVHAQVRDLGEVATGLSSQIGQIGDMIGILAAVLGVGIAIMGLMKFRAHTQNPNDPSNKISSAFVMIFVGASMVALPALLGSGVTTIFGNTSNVISGEHVPSYLDL